jgi:hypothetical protein
MAGEKDKPDCYKLLSKDELFDTLGFLQGEIDFFVRYVFGLPDKIAYSVCGLDIIDAIVRADKRTHYFRVVHNGMNINEHKETALLIYWILKFRPIKITDEAFKNKLGYNNRINELFSIHLLYSILQQTGRLKTWDGREGVEVSLENSYTKELLYSLRFRNFTIDSLIVLADTITTESMKSYRQE